MASIVCSISLSNRLNIVAIFQAKITYIHVIGRDWNFASLLYLNKRYAHMSSAFNLNGCFVLRAVCLQRNDVGKALCNRVVKRSNTSKLAWVMTQVMKS